MVEAFKVGDTVQLKSGGPVMTIVALVNQQLAALAWFDGSTLVVRDQSNELLPVGALQEVKSGMHVSKEAIDSVRR